MALKEARPGWRIRFVTFERANHDFILKNPTLMEGLQRCGELVLLDGTPDGSGTFGRTCPRKGAGGRADQGV